MTAPICIDISHHQGYCDFTEVARAGVLGMIHKATEGSSYEDDMRAQNCSNAIDAGIAIATYHWLSPGSNVSDQIDFYLNCVEPVPGERVVIDYEQDGCTLDGLKKAVQAIMDYDLGLKITVYSGHLLKEQLGDGVDSFLQANTDLWLAQYTSSESNISWPDGTYPEWTLWQYSETGVVPGINDAYVDFNNFNGTSEEFLKWITPTGGRPHHKPKRRRHLIRRLPDLRGLTMPMKSEKQRKAMHAAAAGKSNIGIPKSVGKKFAEHDQGGKLPKKAKSSQRKR